VIHEDGQDDEMRGAEDCGDGPESVSAARRAAGDLDVYDASVPEVRVLADRCFDCILRSGEERLAIDPAHIRERIATVRANRGYIVCHNTYPPLSADTGRAAVCRGFFDAYALENTAFRLALAFGIITEVAPPDPALLPPRAVGRGWKRGGGPWA
jgi:hypothetical protein